MLLNNQHALKLKSVNKSLWSIEVGQYAHEEEESGLFEPTTMHEFPTGKDIKMKTTLLHTLLYFTILVPSHA